MAQVILLTASSEETGRIQNALLLADALAKQKRTLLIDLDTVTRSLDMFCNVENRIVYTLQDCLMGKSSLRDAMVRSEKNLNLYLMFSSLKQHFPTETDVLPLFCKQLLCRFDMILLQIGAESPSFLHAAKAASRAVIMSSDTPFSLRGAKNIRDYLFKKAGLEDQRIILWGLSYKEKIPIDDLIDRAGMQLVGMIPAAQELALKEFPKLLEQKNAEIYDIYVEIATRLLEL